MKKKLLTYLRIIVLIALAGLAAWGLVALIVMHRSTCPELYAPGHSDYIWLYLVLCALGCLLMPVFTSVGALMTGYRLHRMRILFIEIKQEDKLRVRLSKRPGLGTFLLSPRIDGTSPYKLALLSMPLSMMVLAGLCLALAALLWRTGPAVALLIVPAACLGIIFITLLPRRNGSDILSRLLAFRNRDKLRAWECAMHIAAALGDSKTLMGMPEEWFQRYPAEIADDLYVANCLINGSSRLIRQGRFPEAYDMLRPLLDLTPAPENHQIIACALLNGAICEALTDLPPLCLRQLEHPSIRYMCPPSWEPRRRTVQYAQALLLDHDEAKAAPFLLQIEKDIQAGHTDGKLIRRIQEKAGIGGIRPCEASSTESSSAT